MLTILVKTRSKDHKYLVVNDVVDEQSSFHYYDEKYKSAEIANPAVIRILLEASFSEIAAHLTNFIYQIRKDWWENIISVDIDCAAVSDAAHVIRIVLEVEPEKWSKPWSLTDFSRALAEQISIAGENEIVYHQEDEHFISNGFGIRYTLGETDTAVGPHVNKALARLEDLLRHTNKSLLLKVNAESLTTFFHFPEETATYCKQYLIYFGQFLADIGIDAETEIKEEAGSTLFRVVPKNRKESLRKIKEALEIYLNAPGISEFESEASLLHDVAVKQWEANIFHLKSQLALAKAFIQTKDAQIDALQLSNYQYRQLILKGNMEDQGEDIIPEIVTVRKFETRGLSINLPEILRRLKRLFRKAVSDDHHVHE